LFWKWFGFAILKKWYELVVTLWFWWFCRSRPMKHTCILYCTHMWSKCIHSWGIGPCLVGFDLFVSIILKLQNERRTLSKMVFKDDYFANLLWIALYDYIKMYEWFLGIEDDIYLNMMYFLLYLDREKLYVSVELCEEVDVSKCIYVDWLRCCWWIHIC